MQNSVKLVRRYRLFKCEINIDMANRHIDYAARFKEGRESSVMQVDVERKKTNLIMQSRCDQFICSSALHIN